MKNCNFKYNDVLKKKKLKKIKKIRLCFGGLLQ